MQDRGCGLAGDLRKHERVEALGDRARRGMPGPCKQAADRERHTILPFCHTF